LVIDKTAPHVHQKVTLEVACIGMVWIVWGRDMDVAEVGYTIHINWASSALKALWGHKDRRIIRIVLSDKCVTVELSTHLDTTFSSRNKPMNNYQKFLRRFSDTI
jgi:hypothetical protein